MMNRPKIVTVCGTALLIAAAVAVVVASRNRQHPAPPPGVPLAASPAEVRVKAVERKTETVERENVTASGAIVIVCGVTGFMDKVGDGPFESAQDDACEWECCGMINYGWPDFINAYPKF